MVDALRRAKRMLTTNGSLIEIHPTTAPASIEVGGQTIGLVDAADAPLRHAAAEAALEAVADEGLFEVGTIVEFDFCTYGDSVVELRDYIVENWRNARIDDEIVERASTALRTAPAGVRPCVRERVRLTTLRPSIEP